MEEFQEAEVLWPEDYSSSNRYYEIGDKEEVHTIHKPKAENTKVKVDSSKPRTINIPDKRVHSLHNDLQEYSTFEDEEEKPAPPHEILAKRLDRKMASFSVCTGNGSRLKGRDLRRVRTSILRMTGFLESG